MSKRLTRTRNSTSCTAIQSQQETGCRRLRACHTCSGCQRVPCRLCVSCRGMVHAATTRKCIFRLCLRFSYSEQTKRRLALAAQRSFQTLSMSHLNTSRSPSWSDPQNNNHSSDVQRFLLQCQTILVQTHGISMEWEKWHYDSSWRVWLYRRQQWGIAERVSSDPPRYDIQLLFLPNHNNNNSSSSISSNPCSIPPPPPPPPRRSKRKNTPATAISSSKKKTEKYHAKMLTNVPPYVSTYVVLHTTRSYP